MPLYQFHAARTAR